MRLIAVLMLSSPVFGAPTDLDAEYHAFAGRFVDAVGPSNVAVWLLTAKAGYPGIWAEELNGRRPCLSAPEGCRPVERFR